jgi:hypothetical protein
MNRFELKQLWKKELEQYEDIPVLEGELEWIIKTLDSFPKSISGIIIQLPSNDDSTQ